MRHSGRRRLGRPQIIKINGGKVPANRCDPKTKEGCDEKELAFIERASAKFGDAAAIATELGRLGKMAGKPMKAEQQSWLARRQAILNKLKDEL